MMSFLYHLGLHIFKAILIIASPFNVRAKKWVYGRKGLFSTIKNQLKHGEKRIWIHAASLGEFEQGRPVIEQLKKQWPGIKIVLTFFSPSGYEIRKNYEYADYVFYLPLDTRYNALRFIELIHPEFVIFVKYEFWRNFLFQLKKKQIPVYLVSAIFRKNQVFFRPWGRWYRQILHTYKHIFVQDQPSVELLKEFGITNTSVSGDTRFDRVYEIASNAVSIPLVEKFTDRYFTIILGSSWKADEEILFGYINGKSPDIRFIIAPHEIHEQNIDRITEHLKKKYLKFSEQAQESVNESDVLIIDNIGLLSSIYRYGKIAYIGGGFGSGIHNILEAATFGLPILFGPNYKKYKEALDLVSSGGAFEVNNATQAGQLLDKLIHDRDFYHKSSKTARDYVEKNRGACNKIVGSLFENHQHVLSEIN